MISVSQLITENEEVRQNSAKKVISDYENKTLTDGQKVLDPAGAISAPRINAMLLLYLTSKSKTLTLCIALALFLYVQVCVWDMSQKDVQWQGPIFSAVHPSAQGMTDSAIKIRNLDLP